VIGGAPSSWAATNERNFGKDLMFDLLGSAEMLWSGASHDAGIVASTVQALLPHVRRRLSATSLPSDYGKVSPLRLSEGGQPLGAGRLIFNGSVEMVAAGSGARTRLDRQSRWIAIGKDVSSIIFLHAADKPATNVPAYEATWNYDDTAELLGWYEVVYADGFVATVPVRYGINILEKDWGRTRSAATAYEATVIPWAKPGASPLSFFAYEWVNPRFGKTIRAVRLRGAEGFADAGGRPAPDNAIILAAVSIVEKEVRPAEDGIQIRNR
jgi:hypothetical protein